jgi:hypothetical protein
MTKTQTNKEDPNGPQQDSALLVSAAVSVWCLCMRHACLCHLPLPLDPKGATVEGRAWALVWDSTFLGDWEPFCPQSHPQDKGPSRVASSQSGT